MTGAAMPALGERPAVLRHVRAEQPFDRIVEEPACALGRLLEATLEGGLVRLIGEQQPQQRLEVQLGVPWRRGEPGVHGRTPVVGDLVDRPLSTPLVLGACVVAAFTADLENVATADIEIPEPFLHVQPEQSLTVTPQGTVHVAGQLFYTPAGRGDVDIDGTITQVVEDRTISASIRASATCDDLVDSWEADVIGHRTDRFKVGPASLTVRANETVDPFPDDEALRTVDVDLVRPAR